jgi:hypothetical protein
MPTSEDPAVSDDTGCGGAQNRCDDRASRAYRERVRVRPLSMLARRANPTIKAAAYAELGITVTKKAGHSWSPGLEQMVWLTFVSEGRVRPYVHALASRGAGARTS